MSIYCKIPNVSGNVTTRGYQGCIELGSVQHLGFRKIQQVSGQGANRDMSHLKLEHMRITKFHDAASSTLYQALCQAKNIPSLEIYHMVFMDQSPEWRIKIQLHNVLVAQHHEVLTPNASIETIDLAFTNIEKGYKQQNARGQFQAPSMSGYNLETAVAM